MSSSLFNPEQFLDIEVQGEMAVRNVPTPLGRYNFQIKKVSAKRGTSKDGKVWAAFELDCEASGDQKGLDGQSITEATGKEVGFARYQGFLDLTESGSLDLGVGKNVALGRIRAALGMNDPHQPFKMTMMTGQVFSGEVIHRADEKDPETKYAEIRNPLPLGATPAG